MATAEDLAAWEDQLMDELQGLAHCQERVATDTTIPPRTKARFREILKSLDRSVSQVLSRTQKLRTSASSSDFACKASELQRDYRHLLRNITQLLHTINPLPDPSPAEHRDEDLFDMTQLSVELEQLEKMTEITREKLKEHYHEDVVTKLRDVRAENDALLLKLQTLEEEQTELSRIAENLHARISLLEQRKAKSPSEPIPRLIAKRVGEAEKLLKR